MQPTDIAATAPVPVTCDAKTRNGELCPTAPMANGRCRSHGGATPVGIASANFQHGRYAKADGGVVAAHYQVARADPDPLQLRDELALLDARLGQVLESIDSGESGSRWTEVGVAFNRWCRARGTRKEDRAFETLREAIVGGRSDSAAWEDVRAMVQERRKLVGAELTRIQVAQRHLSATEAMVLANRLGEAVKRHVTDDDTLRAIAREFESLIR